MNILLWLGIGLIAGGLAARVLDDSFEESVMDVFLGVVGAVFSGYLLYEVGTRQGTGLNIIQIFTVLLSSVLFIWIRNSIKRTV